MRKTVSLSGKPRQFTASGWIVDFQDSENGEGRVLLVKHKKLATWLEPGGHMAENELPDECVLREVEEETGLKAEIVSEARDLGDEVIETLHDPFVVQLEEIDGKHQHIDFQYLCKITGGKLVEGTHEEHEALKWFSEKELEENKDLRGGIREKALKAIGKATELREKGLF